jgi:hypothetical protein
MLGPMVRWKHVRYVCWYVWSQALNADVGTEAGGFRFTAGAHGAVRVAAWGYWPSDVVAAFAKEAPLASQRLSATGVFTLDAMSLKPQGAEGQEALRTLFRALAAVTFTKGTIVSSNALTRMQLQRLVRECGMDGRISFGEG